METILVMAAHPSDLVLGAGGTLAKYAKEGKHIVTVVFSYGEGTDPVKEPIDVIAARIKEFKKATNLLGIRDTIFLSLSDLKFTSDINEPSTKKKVEDILERYKPKIIFTHRADDPHPAHKATSKFVKEILHRLKLKPKVYMFAGYVPFRFGSKAEPSLVVDVTNYYKTKLAAVKLFKSQKPIIDIVAALSNMACWLAGFKARCKYAEAFDAA